eukprot:79365_1
MDSFTIKQKKTFESRIRDINGKQVQGIFATEDIPKGGVIYDWRGSIESAKKDRFTTQVGRNMHILFADKDMQFYNHSCNPNFGHDFQKKRSIALKDIKNGDELTHFYPANEWQMSEAFYCQCNAKNCVGYVGGTKYLPIGRIHELMHLIAPHCKILLNQQIMAVNNLIIEDLNSKL